MKYLEGGDILESVAVVIPDQCLQSGGMYVYSCMRRFDEEGNAIFDISFVNGSKEDRAKVLESLEFQESFNLKIFVRFALCEYSPFYCKFPRLFVSPSDAIKINGFKGN